MKDSLSVHTHAFSVVMQFFMKCTADSCERLYSQGVGKRMKSLNLLREKTAESLLKIQQESGEISGRNGMAISTLKQKKRLRGGNDETDMVHLTDAIEKGHISVIEHASFTFSLEGISRSCSHQVVRYRIASFTQQSQRYVEFRDPNTFVTPETIQRNEKAQEFFKAQLETQFTTYKKLIDLDIPKEDARFVMPNATKTNLVVTMNARELLHLFAQRCCNRAQWEIREIAWEMLQLVMPVAPLIFSEAGPSCVQLGYCPERDLTCGKQEEVKQKLQALRGDELE